MASSWLVSVGLGVSYLVMMLVGFPIVDRVGRRRLTLIMVPGAAPFPGSATPRADGHTPAVARVSAVWRPRDRSRRSRNDAGRPGGRHPSAGRNPEGDQNP